MTPDSITQWARIEQIGIDVRRSGAHEGMRLYVDLLREELRMTEQFLKEDGAVFCTCGGFPHGNGCDLVIRGIVPSSREANIETWRLQNPS